MLIKITACRSRRLLLYYEKEARYRRCISWILILLAAIGYQPAKANENHLYIRRHFTIDNGLPQNSASALMLDRNGFLWVATQGGLCRFDGSRFVVYNSRNSPLPLDRIQALSLNGQDNLMLLTAKPDQRIYRIDDNYRLIRDQRFKQLGALFYSGYPVVRIDSTLSLRNNEGMVKQVSGTSLWDEAYRVIPIDSSRFYFVEKNTLLFIDTRLRTFQSCGEIPGWTGSTVIGDYLLTCDDRMRYQFWKEGNLVQAPVTPALASLLHRFQHAPGASRNILRNNSSTSSLLRFNSEIWLIKQEGALLDATLLISDIDRDQAISAMLYDEANRILFVGTYTDGIYVYQKNDFETIVHQAGNLQANNIYTLLAVEDTWVLNANFRLDPFRKITAPLPAGFRPAAWSGFYRSPEGHIWYASGNRIHITDSNLRQLRSVPSTPDGSPTTATSFAEDEYHTVWVSSDNAVGRIEGEEIRFLPVPTDYLDRNNINYLFPFDPDWLWLGTENGILPCNKKTGKLGALLLPGNSVKYIFRARDGGIWVCTYGKGIYKYEAGGFVALPPDAGKHLLFAHGIVEDERGFFWIPTNKGLFQCLKAELEQYVNSSHKGSVYYYQHQNIGKYTDEFNGSGGNATVAYCKNLVLLPSIHGILSFDPLAVQPILPDKSILVEYIRCDDRLLETHSSFTLPPGFHQLTVDVSAPYLGNEANNVLEYQLAAISPDWYPVINGRIVYNQLPQGTYHLTIRKRTGFGTGNYAYRTLDFKVSPWWYQTWWFRIAAVFLVAFTVFYFVKRRIQYLQRTKRMLEEKVTERTAALQETIAVLDSSEQELNRINMIQDQALSIILHDIRSPLHYLSLSTKFFNEHIHTLSEEELGRQAASIMTSTDRIDKFANDLVIWLHVNRDTQTLSPERFDLAALLEEVRALYAEMAQQKNNQLLIETVEPGTITADRNKLHLVLRNLVDNANKYCSNGQITLSATVDSSEKKFRIRVTDTGSGIPDEEIRKSQHTSSAPPQLQAKLGLTLVHYFVQLMNGKIEIGREEGKRTVVTIVLPLE